MLRNGVLARNCVDSPARAWVTPDIADDLQEVLSKGGTSLPCLTKIDDTHESCPQDCRMWFLLMFCSRRSSTIKWPSIEPGGWEF